MESRVPIVFFGSGPVAAESLALLLDSFEVVAVVTKPKPAHHRGSFPVIDLANEKKIPLFTVQNKKELTHLMSTEPFSTEVAVLIDFGIIVSQDVIDYFPKGIVNSHFSLLPEWRGADPITFAILSGQKRTGVSLMLLVEAMDEGPVIAKASFDMPANITTPELTAELIELSDSLLAHILPKYVSGEALPASQTGTASYSRKLTKADGAIDFSKSATTLEREILAYQEWPKSYTTLAGIDVIITSATATEDRGTPGSYLVEDRQLLIFCAAGALNIKEIKPAGKQAMPISSFLAGYAAKL